MDGIHGPFYPRPIMPIGPSETKPHRVAAVQGQDRRVRPGRSGEVGTTQILTIKLSAPSPEAGRLLHAEVEILMSAK